MIVRKVGKILLSTILTIIIFILLVKKAGGIDTNIQVILTENTVATSSIENTKKMSEIPQVLLDIAWCESRDNQSKIGYNYRYKIITNEDGSTTSIKYLHSRDIGRFQINEKYHYAEAKALGYDIFTEAGNTKFALLLYNKNGTKDWEASKPCWSDIEAWKAKEKSYY
jgi:hypothetical protein